LENVDYLVDLRAGRHALQSDEPPSVGGGGAAPGPFALVLSGLAACTAITLRMYAQRKAWPLADVEVDARMAREGDAHNVERRITLHGPLDDSQRARLLEISEKTPVTKLVKAGATIHTTLTGAA
jgi:putative redox protein